MLIGEQAWLVQTSLPKDRVKQATLVGAFTLRGIPRQDDPDGGAAIGPGADRHAAVQCQRALLDRLEASPPALARSVVGDLRRDLPVELSDANRDSGRRPAADRLADRLADDLVEADLRLLRQLPGCVEVEVDLDLVRKPDLVGVGAYGSSEALVPQDDRLDVEGEVAQRTDRLPVAFERGRQYPLGIVEPLGFDRAYRGIEHQTDPGHRLDRPVVKEERQPSPLVLLSCDELLGEACPVSLANLGLGQQPGVFGCTSGEVCEHRRAHDVAAVECAVARQAERGDLFAVNPQRKKHRALGRRSLGLLPGREHLRPRTEDALRLAARLLEDLRRLPRLRDRAHRLYERVEEGRLRDELTLFNLMPAPLGEQNREGSRSRGHDRRGKADPGDPVPPGGEPDAPEGRTGNRRQEPSPTRGDLHPQIILPSGLEGPAGKAAAASSRHRKRRADWAEIRFSVEVILLPGLDGPAGKAAAASSRHRERRVDWVEISFLVEVILPRGLDGPGGKAAVASSRHRKRRLSR